MGFYVVRSVSTHIIRCQMVLTWSIIPFSIFFGLSQVENYLLVVNYHLYNKVLPYGTMQRM